MKDRIYVSHDVQRILMRDLEDHSDRERRLVESFIDDNELDLRYDEIPQRVKDVSSTSGYSDITTFSGIKEVDVFLQLGKRKSYSDFEIDKIFKCISPEGFGKIVHRCSGISFPLRPLERIDLGQNLFLNSYLRYRINFN